MCHKFRESKRVWIEYGRFKYRRGQSDAARTVLQNALKSLPKRKHIETITKFALMEYRMGDVERGRIVFESVLSNYPKRVDLWNV